MKGVDVVFIYLHYGYCIADFLTSFHVNIEGTFNVLERVKIKVLVYSSSASVYGDAAELPMKEDHIYNNKTFYGATKIAGEHMCRRIIIAMD